MNKIALLLFCAGTMVLAGCPRHIFHETEYVPQIEIQINQTAEQIDDYVTTGAFIPCQARIINYKYLNAALNFPSGVDVQYRNHRSQGGQLNFSATNAGLGTATLNRTLPADGSWGVFYVRGTANSTIDKDAIIEVLENRVTNDGIVLSRKGMQVVPSIAALPSPKVEITFNAESNIDDYLTWSPMVCTIRLVNQADFASDINVTIQNLSGTNRLRFAIDGSLTPLVNTATNASINVTLPESGQAVKFYVSGYFDPSAATTNDRGSSRDKDAVLEVRQVAGNTLLGREGVMVRLRKNANNLSAEERDRFLNAMQTLNNDDYGRYAEFYDMHRADGSAFDNPRFEMHSNGGGDINSSFLPWHRAYLLHLERFLQAIDPSVTIPYWKYDVPAPNVLNVDFMGRSSGSPNASFSAGNPLNTWRAPGEASERILRNPRYDEVLGSPASPGGGGGSSSISDAATLASGTSLNDALINVFEFDSHGPAHLKSGQGAGASASWLNNFDASVKDPLFFLIHSNIDRLWANWQWVNDRFDPANINTYNKPGLFADAVPAPGDRIAEYADEKMWPWNDATGNPAVDGDRPPTAPGEQVPFIVGYLLAPSGTPQVKSLIDYRSNRISTLVNPAFGFAYDDINPFAP